MDEEYHDQVLALTSHLPHLISYTIVATAVDLEEHMKRDVIRFAASGFRDFTRLAGSNPVMWRDVFLNNSGAVLEMLQRFQEDLTYLQRAIRRGDGDTLENLFTRTREIRRGVIEAKQDAAATEGRRRRRLTWSTRPAPAGRRPRTGQPQPTGLQADRHLDPALGGARRGRRRRTRGDGDVPLRPRPPPSGRSTPGPATSKVQRRAGP